LTILENIIKKYLVTTGSRDSQIDAIYV